jgi:hypothetical protein
MPKVIKSQLIEVVNPGVAGGSNVTKIQFPDQPYLRNKKIMGIEILNVNDMALSPTNKVPISTEIMQKAYLTLYLNDVSNPGSVGEWIQSVPFTVLHRIQNSASDPFVRDMFNLQNQVIYWEKCYISVPTALGNTTDISFLLQIYFQG